MIIKNKLSQFSGSPEAIEVLHLTHAREIQYFIDTFDQQLPNLNVLLIHCSRYIPRWNERLKAPKSLKKIDIRGVSLPQAFYTDFLAKCDRLEDVCVDVNTNRFPHSLLGLKSLRRLDLQKSMIEQYPAELFKLPHLEALSFDYPAYFKEELWKNFVTQAKQSRLKALTIYHSRPLAYLDQLTNITALHLVDNKGADYRTHPEKHQVEVGEAAWQQSLKGIQALKKLHTLHIDSLKSLLSKSRFLAGAYHFQLDQLHFLAGIPHLQTLHLTFKVAVEQLLLPGLSQLKALHLTVGRWPYLDLPAHLPQLRVLHLTGTHLGEEGVSDQFLKYLLQLEVLTINTTKTNKHASRLKKLFALLKQHKAQAPLILDLFLAHQRDTPSLAAYISLLTHTTLNIHLLAWEKIKPLLVRTSTENKKKLLEGTVKQVALIGQSPLLNKQAVANDLAAQGLQLKREIATADVVVLCRDLSKQKQTFEVGQLQTRLLLEEDFLEVLNTSKGIVKGEVQKEESLLDLLKNSEPANNILALEMLSNSYVPDPTLHAFIFAIGIYTNDQPLKKYIKAFIKKHLSPALIDLFRQYSRKAQLRKAFEFIKVHPEIDKINFIARLYSLRRERGLSIYVDFSELLSADSYMLKTYIDEVVHHSKGCLDIRSNVTNLVPAVLNDERWKKVTIARDVKASIQQLVSTMRQVTSLVIEEAVIDPSIGRMTQLEQLQLTLSNQSIPATLRKLTQLKRLDIKVPKGNQKAAQVSFGKTFENCKQLALLRIEGEVDPVSLQAVFRLPKLRVVSLQRCEIEAAWLEAMESVEEAYFYRVKFKRKGIQQAIKGSPLTSLKKIYLSKHAINFAKHPLFQLNLPAVELLQMDGKIKKFDEQLYRLSSLRAFYFKKYHLLAVPMPDFSKLPNLQVLEIKIDHKRYANLDFFCEILPKMKQLIHLDIVLHINTKDFQNFLTALSKQTQLQQLHLTFNDFDSYGKGKDELVANFLMQLPILSTLVQLEHLSLYNHVNNDDLKQEEETIRKHFPKLKTLKI